MSALLEASFGRGFNLKACATFLILSSLACALSADVYTLGEGKAGKGMSLDKALEFQKLWIEPVKVNGVPMNISISLVELQFDDCVRRIKELFPEAVVSSNSESMLAETTQADGGATRIYLVKLGGFFPAIQFSVEMPDKKTAASYWPGELPLPQNAEPLQSIELTGRKAAYGFFSTHDTPAQAFSSIKSRLEADGWTSFAPDQKSGVDAGAQGGVFVKGSPPVLMSVSFGADSKNGGSRGALFLHRTGAKMEKSPP